MSYDKQKIQSGMSELMKLRTSSLEKAVKDGSDVLIVVSFAQEYASSRNEAKKFIDTTPYDERQRAILDMQIRAWEELD